MLSEVIKATNLMVKLMKVDFTIFYYKDNKNLFYVSTEDFEVYNSPKFLRSKKTVKKLISSKSTKMIFCSVGDFEAFSNKEKLSGKQIRTINKYYES